MRTGLSSGLGANKSDKATSPFSLSPADKAKKQRAKEQTAEKKKAAEAERWFGAKDYDAKMQKAWDKRAFVSRQYSQKKQERYELLQKLRLASQRGDKSEVYRLSGQIRNFDNELSGLNTLFNISTSQMMDGSFNVAAGGTMTEPA